MKEVNIISKVVGRSGAEASPSSAILPNMSGYATKTELNALRNEFNDFLEGDDADVVINKWQDLVEFLDGISEDFDLLSMLGLKADKSELSNYVTLATKQTITGEKNFTGGLKVNGSPIVYDATNKYWKLEGDLLVTGGVTMYASDSSFTPSTIMDAIATDGVNIQVVDGVLTFVGQIGGGVADSVLWDNIEGKPSWIGSSKPSYSYSEISGTPTLLSSFHNDLEFVSKGTTLSHYGITNAIGYLASIIADKADAYNLAGYGTTGGGFPVNGGAIKVGINNYQMILHGRHDTLRFNTVEAGTLKTWRKVWHDGNFNPSDYLPLSGGTLNGNLVSQSIFPLTADFQLGSTTLRWGNIHSEYGTFSKGLTLNGSKVWTAANDGAGSGLDADLLDGLEAGDIQRRSLSFYRAHNTTSVNKTDLNNVLEGMVYNYSSLEGWVNAPKGMTYGQVLAIRNHLDDWLVGQIAWDVNHNSKTDATKNLYFRASDINGFAYSQWHTIAFTDSNVASATKLETARTIWGQSFDGTADISGDLSVGDGDIYLNNNKAIRAYPTSGSSASLLRMSASNNVIVGDISYNTYLYGAHLYFVYGNGNVGMMLNSSGNVLVGTTTDSGYKLDVNGTLRAKGDTTLASKLTLNGIPIYKSQDDVLYIDGNLAVRGGITMYATDAIDVPSIIDALPIASASAKGIASFNPNDFSIVDGYVSFIGKGGVDESVLADYAKKTDLSNYLPLSGGQMTGPIYLTYDIDGGNIPQAGSLSYDGLDGLASKKTFIGSATNKSAWFNMISVRADNGNPAYGMYIYSSMTDFAGNLHWNRQAYGTWQGERVILDSVNWYQYISAGQVGAYLPQSGGNMSGHIFMTGAVADSSTANTSQIVFGTSANNHVCLTSNMKGLIINPSLTDTSGQIALYADVDMESFIQSSLKVYGSLYASVYFNYGGSIAQSYGSSMYVWDNNLQINKTTSGNDYLKTMMFFDLISENIKLNINGKLSFNSYIFWNSDSNNPYMSITYGGRDWYLQAYNNSYIYLGTGIAASIRIDTSGNLLTPGGITMYSDIRKKTKLQDVELSLQQIAEAPLIEHYYNSDAMRTTHVGSIAQYWAGLNDWFCKLDGEGFYTMEIQNAALASAISIARELVKYESKTDKEIRMLKDEVKRLKKEIKILKSA